MDGDVHDLLPVMDRDEKPVWKTFPPSGYVEGYWHRGRLTDAQGMTQKPITQSERVRTCLLAKEENQRTSGFMMAFRHPRPRARPQPSKTRSSLARSQAFTRKDEKKTIR